MKNINNFDLATMGAKLKALRIERNLSMRELASRADVAVSFISKIESGKTSPTIMTLQKILGAMKVPVINFFNHDANVSPSDNIIFRRKDMKVLQGNERQWLFAFPSKSDIKSVMTYEEYKPKTKSKEIECHHTDIFGYIISGELTLDFPKRGIFRGKSGDAFYLKAYNEHIARNDGDKVLKMIVIELTQ